LATLVDRAIRALLTSRGFESRFVTTSVGRVHYYTATGSGRGQMAFLHGFGASAGQIGPLASRLVRRFERVFIFELPAHGFSDCPDPLDIESMERGIVQMLERTLTRPSVVFGNSMGGFAAIRFALVRPDLVSHLVLCSPGGAAMTEQELVELRRIFNMGSHQEALEFMDRLLARPARLRHLYAFVARRKLRDTRLQSLLARVTPDLLLSKDQVSRLSIPTLILWGREDGILPRTGLDFFREHLPPRAAVEELEGFGHSPHIESPGRIAERIGRFLETT
jgi:pyruvate dehydrogenase E2 component (dihydrolipoamide acetyltransferase)